MRLSLTYTLFPYTTLFRSIVGGIGRFPGLADQQLQAADVGLGGAQGGEARDHRLDRQDRKSTRLNSSHLVISYAVFCLKKKSDMVNITSIVNSQETSSINT